MLPTVESFISVDRFTSQMLILATIFQCLNPILSVAAFLSSKPLFLNPMDKLEEATRYASCFIHRIQPDTIAIVKGLLSVQTEAISLLTSPRMMNACVSAKTGNQCSNASVRRYVCQLTFAYVCEFFFLVTAFHLPVHCPRHQHLPKRALNGNDIDWSHPIRLEA